MPERISLTAADGAGVARFRDPELEAKIDVFDFEDKLNTNGTTLYQCATARCKGCPVGEQREWEITVRNGCVDRGTRNALLAHAAVHEPGYHPGMRRRR